MTTEAPVLPPRTDATEDGEAVLELVGHAVRPAGARNRHRRLATRAQMAANLRGNLRDEVALMLVVVLLVAQVADLWTTHLALASAGLQEKNPIFRVLFHSVPGLADAVKLGAIALTVGLTMAVLGRPRARGALLLAASISLIAPISNFLLVAAR